MSVVDSEAVFASRAAAIGLSAEVIQLFKDGGIATLGNLAFASSYVPGSSDDSPFTDLVKKVLGREGSIGEMAMIRRLFNESYAATSAEMKTLVEQTDEAPNRKLAAAERAERFFVTTEETERHKHARPDGTWRLTCRSCSQYF